MREGVSTLSLLAATLALLPYAAVAQGSYGGTKVGIVDQNGHQIMGVGNPAYMTFNVASIQSGTVAYPVNPSGCVVLTNPGSEGTFGYDISGAWSGLVVVQAQAVPGGRFYPTTMVPYGTPAVGAVTSNSAGQGSIAAVNAIELCGANVTSGTATIQLWAGQGSATVMQDNLPWSVNLSQVNGNSVLGIGNGILPFAAVPTTNANAGLAPNVSGSAQSAVVVCSAACNLTDAYVTTSSVSGYLMLFNATSVPADGATTAGSSSGNMQDCVAAPSGMTTALPIGANLAERFSAGATLVFSSTGCGTKTASSTAFLHGRGK